MLHTSAGVSLENQMPSLPVTSFHHLSNLAPYLIKIYSIYQKKGFSPIPYVTLATIFLQYMNMTEVIRSGCSFRTCLYFTHQQLSFGISFTLEDPVIGFFLEYHTRQSRPFCFLSLRPLEGPITSYHLIYVFYFSIAFIWCITHPCIPRNKDFHKIS